MFLSFLLMLVSIMISFMLMSLMFTLGKKSYRSYEKNSVFECGFNPQKKNRTPFSIRFFLVTIIFLIFDIELAILLPFSVIKYFNLNYFFFFMSSLILMILILGLLHEWKQGALNWLS